MGSQPGDCQPGVPTSVPQVCAGMYGFTFLPGIPGRLINEQSLSLFKFKLILQIIVQN